jgi:hypothetical protein
MPDRTVKKVIDDAHQVAFIREAMETGIVNLNSNDDAQELPSARAPDDAMNTPMTSLRILLVIYISSE